MRIKEFAATYCRDILEEADKRESLLDLTAFSYDEIITEDDGTLVPIINADLYQIPIADILGMDRVEFSRVWPYSVCMSAYDNYVSTLTILEGIDALNAVRNELRSQMDRISAYDLIPEEFR